MVGMVAFQYPIGALSTALRIVPAGIRTSRHSNIPSSAGWSGARTDLKAHRIALTAPPFTPVLIGASD